MFGMGMPEIILILAIALIVIGPKKLPEMAKSLGRAMGEFKRATSDFRETLEIDNELSQVKKAFDDMNVEDQEEKRPPAPLKEKKASPPKESIEVSDDPAAAPDIVAMTEGEATKAEKPLAEKEAGERAPESEKPLSQKGSEPETASEKGTANA